MIGAGRSRREPLPQHLLDRRGVIVYDGGVMKDPDMFVLGLPFLRRRKSGFIEGACCDAADLMDPLLAHFNSTHE